MNSPPRPELTSTRLFFRFATVSGLVLLLLVPLALISSVISERTMFRAEAVRRVVQNTAGEQRFFGPFLVVPWTDRREIWIPDAQNQPKRQLEVTSGNLLRTPTKLAVGGKLVPSLLHVGLYDVSVYEWQAGLQAKFAGGLPSPRTDTTRTYGTPYLVFGISDVRGLVGAPALKIDGRATALASGTGVLAQSLGGVHAVLPPITDGRLETLSLELSFALKGTHSLQVVPVADDNRVELTSTWPHPQFEGSSPRSQVSDAGFQALWEISGLASNVQSRLRSGAERSEDIGEGGGGFAGGVVDAVSVSLVNPVDIYTQTERASKYGILFIVLTFVGFALFELVKRLTIHPLQYLLVGLALAIFFLLLLSLSEHLPFWLAYVVSAGSCIGLQFVYLSGVLKRWSRAAGFAALLTSLYGALYFLLASEDNALLMGSLLLFAMLAAVMAITRRVDWYHLSASLPAARAHVPAAPGPASTGAPPSSRA
ncbi:MAG: cell envelope integrity protein CreD [Kofleriaceae bacterium]